MKRLGALPTLCGFAATCTILLVTSCGGSDEQPFDLLIRGGTVIDGTGGPRSTADVAVRDGRIAAVGDLAGARARADLDATGKIVAPGFWDQHAHVVDLEGHETAENFVRQGITTIIGSLHSQEQVRDLDEYRARVRMIPNVGLFAGHNWIREQVLGLEARAPNEEELEQMRVLVARAMEQGALGLATGLEYTPGVYADTDEIVELAKVAAAYGGVYVTHMRDEGVRVMESIEETLDVARRANIPAQINHLKVTGAAHFGQSEEMLARLEAAWDAGLEVAFDVYPYTAFSTYSDLMFPAWALAEGPEAYARRVGDPATRKRLVDEMIVRFTQQAGQGPESILFREVPGRAAWTGRTMADVLEERGLAPNVANAVDLMIELQLEGRFIGTFFGMSEHDVERFLAHPRAMFETDGDLVAFGEGFPHPRSYGSLPRILGRYVRERGVLTLEDAVHRMTGMAADWWGDPERGLVREGAIADLVIFDAERVADRSEYLDPHQFPEGIEQVLVAGVLVFDGQQVGGVRPGRFLERRRGDH